MAGGKELFIQRNSPDGGFLQSSWWGEFQKSLGREVTVINGDGFFAQAITYSLPIVGKYLYVPRGPVIKNKKLKIKSQNGNLKLKNYLGEIIKLAKDNNTGWVKVEPSDTYLLDLIRENWRIAKAPQDVQPKEIFVIDITKSEEELLAQMKSKTRYNIRLAQKKGIPVKAISNLSSHPDPPVGGEESRPGVACVNSARFFANAQNDSIKNYINEFLRLVKITAERNKISSHPENYYKKIIETMPGNILKLYIAEYDKKAIAANLMVFYGKTCTYLHGASDDEYKNVMAPYLLHWQAMKDAREAGCERYDLGGVNARYNSWGGLTRFKLGFSPDTKPVVFPGSYDIVINSGKYWLYRSFRNFGRAVRILR